MATLEEFFAQNAEPKTLEDFFARRPGLLSRGGTHALARTADIADFLEGPIAATALPGLYAGRKVREWLGMDVDADRDRLREEAAALPEAESFSEKAADFLGNVAPDVALGVATSGVSAAGAAAAASRGVASPFMRLLAGEAVQSAALAPLEFGTRDPASAAISTVAGPVVGTAIGRGVSRLLRRGASPAIEPPPPRFDEYGFEEGAPLPTPPTPPPVAIEPLPSSIRQAVVPQFSESPAFLSQEDVLTGNTLRRVWQPTPPPPPPVPPVEAPWTPAPREGTLRASVPPAPQAMPLSEVERIAVRPDAPPDLVESIRQHGIQQPLEIGVTPEGNRILFEGKHRLAAAKELGLAEVPTRTVPIGPGMEAALKQEGVETFARAARLRAQERIISATMAGKPIRTGDLMELGDEEVAAAASEAHRLMQRQSLEALAKAGADDAQLQQAALDLAETGNRLPPRINHEIADAVDSLPPLAAARFAASLKAKGVCPI